MSIWISFSTMRFAGGIPRKELDTSSILLPDPITTHVPPAEESPRRQGKRSRKPCKANQDSVPFSRELVCRTSSNPTIPTAPAMMWST